MRTLAKSALAILSITLVAAADRGFQPGKAVDYPHQTGENVTVGCKVFTTSEETRPIFGKSTDLNRYGVLPVLVVIENNRSQSLDLNGIEVKLVGMGGESIIPLEPNEVAGLANPAKPPKMSRSPIPIPHVSKKNQLDSLAIVEHSFAARVIPPGDHASGFFYFRAHNEPGLRLLINDIFEKPSGKEILYFEVPLS